MSMCAPQGDNDAPESASEADLADEAIAQVMAKELALLAPAVRRDRTAVVRLFHNAFREFGASGRTWDRSRIVEMLATEPGDTAAEAEEMRGVRLGEDVILLTYRARRHDRVSLRSSLWVHDAEGWRLFFHQGTPSPEP